MSTIDFFKEMNRLCESQQWDDLERLFHEGHPLLPGEREALLELKAHVHHELSVQTDDTGLHVVRK